eukprot:3230979-Prorocentrum_lima.AAC.1
MTGVSFRPLSLTLPILEVHPIHFVIGSRAPDGSNPLPSSLAPASPLLTQHRHRCHRQRQIKRR